MKTVILAVALFVAGSSAALATGISPYAANFPILPKPQSGTIVVTPQPNGPLHLPRYPTGPVRNDDGRTVIDGEHTGLGDRVFQPCTFCGGVGR